jgi:hypothetical protein
MLVPGSVNPLLLSGSAAATGYQISRSLRFNSSDSAYCGRTFVTPTTQSIFTFSAWIKRSALGAVQQLFGVSTNHTFGFTSGDALNLTFGGVSALTTTAVFRDPSAWYHVVWTQNGTGHTVYVNGSSVGTATATSSVFNTAVAHQIGAGNTTNFLSGYLTEIHFIDGAALTPSSFGEFDTNGIWQPKQYTGTYGTNGFKLNFSDNSTAAALGTDTSGNGNTWSVNNIVANSTPVPTLSYNLYVAGGQNNVLDTVTTNFARIAATSYGTYYWQVTFASPITFSSSVAVRVYTENTANVSRVVLNGTVTTNLPATTDNTVGTLVTLTTTGLTSITTLRFEAYQPGAWGANLFAIEVDGNRLTYAPDQVDSLVDVPTNGAQTDTGVGGEVRGNYCTLNPVVGGANSTQITFANGNLEATWSTAAGYAVALGTIGVSSGKWYWETTYASGASALFGVATASSSLTNYIGSEASSYGYYSLNGNVYNNNTASAYGSAYAINDVIGIALDLDNGKIYFSKNGTWQNSGSPTGGTGAAYSSLTGTFFPAYADANTSAASSYVANFGQRPFAYTAPSGYKALCTANLPAPLVTKPSTVMDVVTYTGNGSYPRTISGLGFSPDLIWTKVRSQAYRHMVADVVRGTAASLTTNNTNAESLSDPYGWVSAFNSDGWQIQQGSTSGENFNANNDTYVAWTWDAGSSTVTNTQGSITSSVRANASAGFSIVSYTGTGTNGATVGHGLGVVPGMVIVKSRSNAYEWPVYHSSLTSGNNLFLHLTNAQNSVSGTVSAGGVGAVSSTTFTCTQGISNINNTNANGATYVAYCFAPVAGYSSFGSYTGNGVSGDGVFVYTGMRPRFLLIKRTDTADNWVIWDTARETYNPSDDVLLPNSSGAEATGDNFARLDILSNGFKLRNTSFPGLNGSGASYVWAAFAESPFQYARAR